LNLGARSHGRLASWRVLQFRVVDSRQRAHDRASVRLAIEDVLLAVEAVEKWTGLLCQRGDDHDTDERDEKRADNGEHRQTG